MNDLYTKTVLSIIAAALLALVAQNAVHSSQAQSGPQKVALTNPGWPAGGPSCLTQLPRF
jgi:hypothetical protein